MNRAGKGLIRITVTGILFLLLFLNFAAAENLTITASCPAVCGEWVTARAVKNQWILNLPGAWDLSKISLEITGVQTILLGPEKIRITSGQETDLTGFAGQRLSIRHERNYEMGSLTILQGSVIPSLFLEVDKTQLSQVNRDKHKQITDGRAVYLEADGTVSYDGALDQLKGRGNNSFLYAKKPYQLKLREKAPLSGMGSGRTWVLLSNWVDVSLLRNQIVLDLCRAIGLKNAVSCVQADVWINGSYNGLYLIAEKIQIGKSRIDITNLEKATEKVNAEPFNAGRIASGRTDDCPILRSYPAVKDPEDITGGYIFTMEKRSRMNDHIIPGFRTKDGLNIRIKEPTYPSKAQTEYLAARVTEMQQALISTDGIQHVTGKSFEEYLDVTSFAQRFLVEDWTKNYDYTGGSQFMYKDSDLADPLVYAGPSWDYDLCFGNMGNRGYKPAGRYLTANRKTPNLWWLLWTHNSFRRKVCELWEKDFRPAVAVLLGETEAGPDSIIRPLEEYHDRISASVQMDNKRWGISHDATGRGSGESFDNAVKYMAKWIAERTAWMDGEYRTETAAGRE